MNYAEQIKAKLAAAKAITKAAQDASRDLSDDELKQIEALTSEVADLRKRKEDADRRASITSNIEETESWLASSAGRQTQADALDQFETRRTTTTLAERLTKVRGTPRNFKGPDAKKNAYTLGQFTLAVMGNNRAQSWCREQGVPFAALADHNESQNWVGGYLVPEALDASIIDLREMYGVFPRLARRVPMSSDTTRRIRRASGLTAYFVAEQSATTKSNKTWDQISLTAKEIASLGIYSNVLSDDAIINLGDDIAGEAAYAIASTIDDCGFNGDGTSTYGGIVGVRTALTNLDTSDVTNIAGLYYAGGGSTASSLWSEIATADFANVMALLPEFAETPNVGWICSKAFWGSVMVRLAYAGGGNSTVEIQNGVNKSFMGYPVYISQKMPRTTAVSTVCCLFGDLALAADFGDRSGTTIALSRDATIGSINLFETRQTAVQVSQRFDINVHDVGNASSTAASRQPGPIVGLITAAS